MPGLIKRLCKDLGYELSFRRIRPPGSHKRPVGQMEDLLHDLAAKGVNPSRILDVGAHKGEWAQMADKAFPGGRFFLVEPLQEMRDELERFCSTHPGSKYIAAAAGSRPGEITITLPRALASASCRFPDSESLQAAGLQRSVPVTTLDLLIAEGNVDPPDFVKIDVEGYELEVLRGGESLFRTAQVLIIESSLFCQEGMRPTFQAVLQFMHEREFVLYDFAGFWRRPSDGALTLVDGVFTRKSGLLRANLGTDEALYALGMKMHESR